MKLLISIVFTFQLLAAYAQSVPVQQPVEERYQTNYWWWVLGVLLAIGAGIGLYMLIKKDPKRDAVR